MKFVKFYSPFSFSPFKLFLFLYVYSRMYIYVSKCFINKEQNRVFLGSICHGTETMECSLQTVIRFGGWRSAPDRAVPAHPIVV